MYTFTYMRVYILTEIRNLCMNEGNSTKGFLKKEQNLNVWYIM